MDRNLQSFLSVGGTILLALTSAVGMVGFLFAFANHADMGPKMPAWELFTGVAAILLVPLALSSFCCGSLWPGKPATIGWIAGFSYLLWCLCFPIGLVAPILAFLSHQQVARSFWKRRPQPIEPRIVLLRPPVK